MKTKHFFLAISILFIYSCNSTKNIFELESQSMGMVGQGPGKDGAINPYEGQTTMAIVKNLGEHIISIRIERPNQAREIIDVAPKTKKSVILQPEDKLFFDSEKKTKTKLTFRRYKA